MSKFTQALNRVQATKDKPADWPEQVVQPFKVEHRNFNLRHLRPWAWILLNLALIPFIYHLGVMKGVRLASDLTFASFLESEFTPGEGELPVLPEVEMPLAVEAPAAVTPPVEEVPVEPAAAVEEAGPVVPEKGFTIQLVTYTREQDAGLQAEKLTQQGHRVFIIPSGRYYQLCVDVFARKADAVAKMTEFKATGYTRIFRDAFVRNIGG